MTRPSGKEAAIEFVREGKNTTSSTVLITGSGAGIGLHTARPFASKGWNVGIYDINTRSAEQAPEGIGSDHGCCGITDVCDHESVQMALDDFAEQCDGRLDVLVNNAGVFWVNPFEEVSLEEHHRHIDVNAEGLLICSYLAFPLLRDTPGRG